MISATKDDRPAVFLVRSLTACQDNVKQDVQHSTIFHTMNTALYGVGHHVLIVSLFYNSD